MDKAFALSGLHAHFEAMLRSGLHRRRRMLVWLAKSASHRWRLFIAVLEILRWLTYLALLLCSARSGLSTEAAFYRKRTVSKVSSRIAHSRILDVQMLAGRIRAQGDAIEIPSIGTGR
jgi:hypothetical protein